MFVDRSYHRETNHRFSSLNVILQRRLQPSSALSTSLGISSELTRKILGSSPCSNRKYGVWDRSSVFEVRSSRTERRSDIWTSDERKATLFSAVLVSMNECMQKAVFSSSLFVQSTISHRNEMVSHQISFRNEERRNVSHSTRTCVIESRHSKCSLIILLLKIKIQRKSE